MKRLRAAAGPVHGEVTVPGSKSIANRALVAAALADGDSRLTNVPDGDDTAAMLRCLAGLGVDVEAGDDGVVLVGGSGGRISTRGPRGSTPGSPGTTSRFVTALAALADRPVTIDGDPPLRTRPMGELHDALGRPRRAASTTASAPATCRSPSPGRSGAAARCACAATCPASSSPP